MNTSDTKSSAFMTRFRAKLNKDKAYFAPLMLMQMLGMPLLAAVSAWYGSSISNASSIEEADMSVKLNGIFLSAAVISAVSAAAALVICVLNALSGFRYLHRKTESDMNMSLPLSGTQMFMADFFSGLITCMIPLVTAAAVTSAVVWFSPEHRFWAPHEFSSLLGLDSPAANPDYPLHTNDFYTSFSHQFAAGILYRLIPSTAMIYTFTVLICILCGHLFETVIYLAGSNIAAAAFIISLKYVIFKSVPNISFESFSSSNLNYEAERIVPALTLHHIFSGSEYGETGWFLATSLFTAVYFLLAWKLFTSRKAERTSEPFAYNAFFYVVSALITGTMINALMLSFFFGNAFRPASFAVILFTAAAVFTVMLLVKSRGIHIKKPVKQLVFFTASFCAASAVFFAVTETDAFGLTYRIPEADRIACAQITLPGMQKEDYTYIYNPEPADSYTSPDAIREVISLNEKLNSEMKTFISGQWKRNPELYYHEFAQGYENTKYKIAVTDDETVRISYKLKNGKTYDRMFIAENTDYTACPLYTVRDDMIQPESDPEILFSVFIQKEGIFCGSTDYLYELNGKPRRFSVSSEHFYPEKYRITGYDEDLLHEICTHLYHYYMSEENCFVFSLSGAKQYFLPAEYADLYEKFINSGTPEELEWNRMS